MSSNINELGSSQVLNTRENPAPSAQNDGVEQIKEQLREVDAKIQYWKEEAFSKEIDISDERMALISLEEAEVSDDEDSKEGLTLADILAKKATLCIRIRKKVTERPTEQEKIDSLRKQLFDLTNDTVVPYIKLARHGEIDIQQEWDGMHAANLRALESYREIEQGVDLSRELILKSLIVIRTGHTCRIIQKCFEKLIKGIGVEEARKDLDNKERLSIITTITEEAVSRLSCEGGLDKFERHCKEVFECFQKNIAQYNEDPEEYNRQADREWLLRSINLIGARVIHFARIWRNPDLEEGITTIRARALSSLGYGEEVNAIQERFKQELETLKNSCLEEREKLHWTILDYAPKLYAEAQAQKLPKLAEQVWKGRAMAIKMIEDGIETSKIQKKVLKFFKMITERLGMVPELGGCGFKDRPFKKDKN